MLKKSSIDQAKFEENQNRMKQYGFSRDVRDVYQSQANISTALNSSSLLDNNMLKNASMGGINTYDSQTIKPATRESDFRQSRGNNRYTNPVVNKSVDNGANRNQMGNF